VPAAAASSAVVVDVVWPSPGCCTLLALAAAGDDEPTAPDALDHDYGYCHKSVVRRQYRYRPWHGEITARSGCVEL